jgi:hypothetical protein
VKAFAQHLVGLQARVDTIGDIGEHAVEVVGQVDVLLLQLVDDGDKKGAMLLFKLL